MAPVRSVLNLNAAICAIALVASVVPYHAMRAVYHRASLPLPTSRVLNPALVDLQQAFAETELRLRTVNDRIQKLALCLGLQRMPVADPIHALQKRLDDLEKLHSLLGTASPQKDRFARNQLDLKRYSRLAIQPGVAPQEQAEAIVGLLGVPGAPLSLTDEIVRHWSLLVMSHSYRDLRIGRTLAKAGMSLCRNPEALGGLLYLARHDDQSIRGAAIEGLEPWLDREEVLATMKHLATADVSGYVREKASEALARKRPR